MATTKQPSKHLRTCECGAKFKTQVKVGHPFERCPKCRKAPRQRRAA